MSAPLNGKSQSVLLKWQDPLENKLLDIYKQLLEGR